MKKSEFSCFMNELFVEGAAFLFYFLEWFHVALLIVVLHSKRDSIAELFAGYGATATVFDIFLNLALLISFSVPALMVIKAEHTKYLASFIQVSALSPLLTALLYIGICLSSGFTWYSMVSMIMALLSIFRFGMVTECTKTTLNDRAKHARNANRNRTRTSRCSNTYERRILAPRQVHRVDSRSSSTAQSTSTTKLHSKPPKSFRNPFSSIFSKTKSKNKSNVPPNSQFSSASDGKADQKRCVNYNADNKSASKPPDDPPSYASVMRL